MSSSDNWQSVAAIDSAVLLSKVNRFVFLRRRYIEDVVNLSETSSDGMRLMQAKVEELRAVSGSPSLAMQGILRLMVGKLDELTNALEIQYIRLGTDPSFEEDRERCIDLLAHTTQIHRNAIAVLGQSQDVGQGVA